jgi:hypothetical protein
LCGFGSQGQDGIWIGEGVGHERADFIRGTRHFAYADGGSVEAVLALFHLPPQLAGGDGELRVEVAADDGGVDVKAQRFHALILRLCVGRSTPFSAVLNSNSAYPR